MTKWIGSFHAGQRWRSAARLLSVRWNFLLGILHIPHNSIGTKILFVWPHNTMVGGADKTKIRFVCEFLKSTAMQIGFHVKNSRNATTCKNIDSEVIQWISFYDFVHFGPPFILTDQS